MQLGDAGLRLIAEFEGFRSHPYLDVVGIPTIGYGNTYYPDTGRRVTLADAPVTEREAADMLLATLARYVDVAPPAGRFYRGKAPEQGCIAMQVRFLKSGATS